MRVRLFDQEWAHRDPSVGHNATVVTEKVVEVERVEHVTGYPFVCLIGSRACLLHAEVDGR